MVELIRGKGKLTPEEWEVLKREAREREKTTMTPFKHNGRFRTSESPPVSLPAPPLQEQPLPTRTPQVSNIGRGYTFPINTIVGWKAIHDSLQTLIFVRGLPGVGKTTFAKVCFPERKLFEADLFAQKEGVHSFADRHAACRRALQRHVTTSSVGAIVCNTFTEQWELKDYLKEVGSFSQDNILVPVIIHIHEGSLTDAELAQRTRHAVPEYVIRNMRNRWASWPGELLVSYGCEE